MKCFPLYCLLMIVFVCNGVLAQAQTTDSVNEATKNKFCRASDGWQLSWKALQLVDPTAGTIQIGVEKRLSKSFLAEFDFGIPFNALKHGDKINLPENYRYTKLCFELKYILNKNGRILSNAPIWYLGLRSLYFPQHYRLHNDFVWKDTAFYPYDYSDLKRNVLTFDIATGAELSRDRFVFNIYSGLGVRILKLDQIPNHLGEPTLFLPHAEEDFSSHLYRHNGTFYRPDFVLGIRVGYRLGKK